MFLTANLIGSTTLHWPITPQLISQHFSGQHGGSFQGSPRFLVSVKDQIY